MCPSVATSYAEAKKLAAAQKPALDSLLAKQGLKMLFSVPWPPQGIFAAKPINAGADLKGVK
jgi:TRAP-type C4-dicarboxylate transport system substrate-binding protein